MFGVLCWAQIWMWRRCRSWPAVAAVFEPSGPPDLDSLLVDYSPSVESLKLVYTYAGESYERPAYTAGAVGQSVPILVNPRDPQFSSLIAPFPRLAMACLVLVILAFLAILLRAITAA